MRIYTDKTKQIKLIVHLCKCINCSGGAMSFTKMPNKLKLEDVQYFENTSNIFQKAFIALQSNCVLCSSNLEISISYSDSETHLVELKEEAHCPQCEMRMRSKLYTIQ